jgi:hypothetical protein
MALIDLPAVAAAVRKAHGRVIESCRMNLQHAKRVGELLNFAKDSMAHGHWQQWVVEHCGFSPRSARNYMRIARSCYAFPPPPDESSCRAALRALARKASPRKMPRVRPTPDMVADRMTKFGITAGLHEVIQFLRSFGVKVENGSTLPFCPTGRDYKVVLASTTAKDDRDSKDPQQPEQGEDPVAEQDLGRTVSAIRLGTEPVAEQAIGDEWDTVDQAACAMAVDCFRGDYVEDVGEQRDRRGNKRKRVQPADVAAIPRRRHKLEATSSARLLEPRIDADQNSLLGPSSADVSLPSDP